MTAKFTKTTEARYWEMLEVLPPEIMTGYGFLVGEPMDHNSQGQPRFSAFVEWRAAGQMTPRQTIYFESVAPMTVAEFKAVKVADLIETIKEGNQ